MSRGRLRVFLGAAPGVGKTFSMLQEGHRLQHEGRDVVVGFVESHGRADLAPLIDALETVATRPTGSNQTSGEMDIEAVLARQPQVVLVDELAHTNSPGSGQEKRWLDVETLLDANIDVLTTLNVQHLETLNDIVFEITGVRETETIPDGIVRRATEIELIDLTEEGIRRRLTAGKIFPADEIDAALANYFRPGNLAALRGIALSWTADRVEETLDDYRGVHEIDHPWETKERTVVALGGSEGGEVVIRRAARASMRSRSALLGVYVRPTDGAATDADPYLRAQRKLLEGLGGRYHEVVGNDVAEAILAFAKAENASRIIVGASRRSSFGDWLRGSPVMPIIRGSGTIEVLVVSYDASHRPRIRRVNRSGVLGLRRRLAAWLLTIGGLPLLTLVLLSFGDRVALENVLLVYLMVAVGVGVVGGAFPAVVCASAGFLLANWYFTPPFETWKIDDASQLFSLFAFLLVASAVGLLVGNATRRSAEARKARAQAEALAATTTYQVFGPDTTGMTRRVRDVFALNAAAVLRRTGDTWEPVAAVGISELRSPDDADEVIPLTDDTVLALTGGTLTGDDRRVLRAFAAQMAQALERERLQGEAATVDAMAETDRLRTALLSAVSHDLRTPLATIKASVTSLLETNVAWTVDQTRAFLRAILQEAERLNRVVGRLLDASRVQVGAVHVFFLPVGLDEIVSSALPGLAEVGERVFVEIPESLPRVQTDPALMERVVANLIENALTWSPNGQQVRVTAGEVAGRIDLRIIDRGPGIPSDDRETIFQPFQRLGDSSSESGVGLGMAVARGFLEAMGHELAIEDTPGGGTTMVIGFELGPTVNESMTTGQALRA